MRPFAFANKFFHRMQDMEPASREMWPEYDKGRDFYFFGLALDFSEIDSYNWSELAVRHDRDAGKAYR
jgi:hypothetical protein